MCGPPKQSELWVIGELTIDHLHNPCSAQVDCRIRFFYYFMSNTNDKEETIKCCKYKCTTVVKI